MSLKASAAAVGPSFVGAASATGLKGFQVLDGQWKGLSLTETPVTSSSDDSFMLAALVGACVVGGAVVVVGTS